MSLYQRIKNLLDSNNIEYKETKHEPVFTSEEAAKVRGTDLSAGAKALIFRADDQYIQIIIQGHLKVDKDKFKEQFGYKKLKMVSAEEVKEISGVEPGAVAPFGNLFEPAIKVFCNEGFNAIIEFNAGNHKISINMKYDDWKNLVNPIIGSYGKHK